VLTGRAQPVGARAVAGRLQQRYDTDVPTRMPEQWRELKSLLCRAEARGVVRDTARGRNADPPMRG